MKTKVIIFMILLPIFEILAVLLAFMMQAVYVIRVNDSTASFMNLFLGYIAHPFWAIRECIDIRNPFILILPILAVILLLFLMLYKPRVTSRIDDSGIYGTANWATIESLPRKNIVGKRKFDTCTKKKFLNDFLESIDENTKKETKKRR